MRVLIATTQVPFIRGGAEMHAESLQAALIAAGHEAETVRFPFKWYPPERILEHILAMRLFDVTESSGRTIDRVIGLKFPAYVVPHPNKILWILHQHRTAYELWGSDVCDLMQFPNGREVRDAIKAADDAFIPEARAIYANSRNVAARLNQFNGIEAEPLYHPPPAADSHYCAPAEDFLYVPSRVNRMKRQLLIVEALGQCREPVRLRFSGPADDPAYERQILERAATLALGSRVEFLGNVSDIANRDLYARCLAVVFVPIDEDYGYVTLEAMLSQKPVITCSDSGGPLEFVQDRVSGLVVAPDPVALAAAMDQLWQDRKVAAQWGQTARETYADRNISWAHVVERLTCV